MRKESLIVWGIAVIVMGVVVYGIYNMSGSNPNELVLTEPVSASDHVRGATGTKAVLVEYGDYQCPACYQYEPLLQNILKDEAGKVSVVFRNFPLPQHPNAVPAAYAAEAAALQGKFWEMHDLIYEHQNDWSGSSDAGGLFEQYAQTLKLDIATFKKDIASSQVAERVSHDTSTANASGVRSTPTFFLNGKTITIRNYDQLKQLIESVNAGS